MTSVHGNPNGSIVSEWEGTLNSPRSAPILARERPWRLKTLPREAISKGSRFSRFTITLNALPYHA